MTHSDLLEQKYDKQIKDLKEEILSLKKVIVYLKNEIDYLKDINSDDIIIEVDDNNIVGR